MPIHPARFSGRPRSKVPTQPSFKLGNWTKRSVKLAFFIFFAVAVVQAGRVAASLVQPLQSLPNQKTYPVSTNYQDRTNLLLARLDGSEVSFLAVASIAEGQEVKFLPINLDLYTSLARGHGYYRISSAWKLGNLDGEDGLNLLRDSVSRMLAVPIDGYLATDATSWKKLSQEFGGSPQELATYLASPRLFLNIFQIKPWGEGIYSSVSKPELIKLALLARSSGVKELSLDGVVVQSTEAGQDIRSIDPGSFDSLLGKEFQDDLIAKTHPKVSIINASNVSGAGNSLGRYVKNLGGEVITIESGAEVKKSEIRDHLGGSKLSERLAPLIKAEVIKDKTPKRADIEIIIGSDNQGWF